MAETERGGEGDAEPGMLARGRRISDMVFSHETLLIEHKVLLPILKQQLDSLQEASATREGLTAAVATLQLKIESAGREYSLKLQTIQEALSTIQRGINWMIGIILSAVLVAVMALILRVAP